MMMMMMKNYNMQIFCFDLFVHAHFVRLLGSARLGSVLLPFCSFFFFILQFIFDSLRLLRLLLHLHSRLVVSMPSLQSRCYWSNLLLIHSTKLASLFLFVSLCVFLAQQRQPGPLARSADWNGTRLWHQLVRQFQINKQSKWNKTWMKER